MSYTEADYQRDMQDQQNDYEQAILDKLEKIIKLLEEQKKVEK